MTEAIRVRGTAAEPFETIADVLGRMATTALPRGGAALTIRHHGKQVADLVVGDYDPARRQVLFSVTKLFTAVTVFRLRDAAVLDLDEPMSDRWPALARDSTRKITLRQVLSHRSGVNGVDGKFAVDGFWSGGDITAAARQEPRWEPGSRHGYHAVTFGSLITGYVQHVTGTPFAEHVNATLAPVVGSALHLGPDPDGFADLQPIQFSEPRLIEIELGYTSSEPEPGITHDALLMSLLEDVGVFNTPEFVSACIPGLNGIGTSAALAIFVDGLRSTNPDRILSETTITELSSPHSAGLDATLKVPSAFGVGVQLPFPRFPMGSRASFGHEGAGGCAAFVDPERELAIGFTTTLFPPFAGGSPLLAGTVPTILRVIDDLAG